MRWFRPSQRGLLHEAEARWERAEEALEESSARYRAIFEGTPFGIALCDLEGRAVESNPAFQDITGYSGDELPALPFSHYTHPEDRDLNMGLFTELLEGKRKHYQMEKRYVRSDGGIVWVHMTVSLLRDASNNPQFVIAIVENISKRKQAEAERRRSETFLDSVIENIPNMIFVKDADELRFVRFNKAGEQLIGHSREDLIGKNDYDFFPKEEADFFTAKDQEVLTDGRLVDIPEEPIQTKHRGQRILHTKKIPILDEKGRPQYLLGISEDITERKQAEEEVRQAKDEAVRANQAKSEFLSRMSHELRTPLNAILGFGELLELDISEPEHRESIGHIVKGGRHLLELINEVLDVSRIESDKLSLSLEPVDLAQAFEECVALIRPSATHRDIDLTGDCLSGPSMWVRADRQRLNQVLLNLLSNAVKYNREKGVVTLGCEGGPQGTVRVSVTDSGIGIPRDKMQRLFNPFDRLGAERSDVEGTGLGLSLSKGLVEKMGGTIGVESEVGKGSTFWVELPLTDPPVVSEVATLQAPPEGRHGPLSLLYIEDNLSNLQLVERFLSRRPQVRLIPAMQGRLGLELAREHRPDLILLDVHLPDIGGEIVLQLLREDPITRDIGVVVISADATERQRRQLLEAGALDYLTKPLSIKSFLETVDQFASTGSN
jgi:PAS domain S-box-containing protein